MLIGASQWHWQGPGPSGRSARLAMSWSIRSLICSSLKRRTPSSVAARTSGKIFRAMSGPPVAESSSAASYSAWITANAASFASKSGR